MIRERITDIKFINHIIHSCFKVAVFFILSFKLDAQTHQLTGKTQDSLQNPIANTNMIATPILDENVNITFAISSLEGEYKLKLQDNISYQIAITHLGYKKVNNTCIKPQKTIIFGNVETY